MKNDGSFLGQGWGFPPRFNNRFAEVKLVSEDEDIKESLKILLSTSPGERIMQPTYGCGIRSLVFENINESTLTQIKDLIERAVLFFEARIRLDNIEVDSGEQAEGLLKIQLNYTVRTTNSRGNIVYPFYFREGTDIAM